MPLVLPPFLPPVTWDDWHSPDLDANNLNSERDSLVAYMQALANAVTNYFETGQSPRVPALNAQNVGNIGAALTVAVAAGQTYIATATANGTVTFSGVTAGQQWTFQHQQDSTGGRRTLFSGVTWLGGAGAVTPAAGALDLFQFFSPDGVAIYGFQITAPVYGAPAPYQAASVLETGPRVYETTARGTVAGTLYARHFKPDHDLLVGNIQSACAGTVAAGSTLARMGLATYNGAGSYTTIARTASDVTLWNAVGYARRAIADDGAATPNAIASVQLKAGIEYAALVLCVGASTAPQLAGVTVNQSVLSLTDASAKTARIAASLAGQTDVPASFTTNAGTASVLWGACD